MVHVCNNLSNSSKKMRNFGETLLMINLGECIHENFFPIILASLLEDLKIEIITK